MPISALRFLLSSIVLMLLSSVPVAAQMMEIEEEGLPQEAKASLTPVMIWPAREAKPKAVFLCVHGLGLHKGSYESFGKTMAERGYSVYSVDIRGFGEFGQLAGVDRKCDFKGCLQDVIDALELVHRENAGAKVFLLGESMGGAIALRVTSLKEDLVDGLISSVPGGDRFHQAGASVAVGLKLLTAPNKEMDIRNIVVNQSTDKQELKDRWQKDPFARLNLRPTELLQFSHFMADNEKCAQLIKKTPVLVVHGKKDHLVKGESNLHIYEKIPCPDREMIVVEDNEHLIFEEGQFKEDVILALEDWVKSHLSSSKISSKQ